MKKYNEFILEVQYTKDDPYKQLFNGVMASDVDSVRDAIEKGANVNDQKILMLSYRQDNRDKSISDYIDVLDLLVGAGMNIHAQDDSFINWTYTTMLMHDKMDQRVKEANTEFVKYFLTYIINNEPENIGNYIQYLPQDEEFKDRYPWLYAAKDHGLLGLKRNIQA